MALQTKDPSTAEISSVGAALSGGTTTSTKPVITGTADAGNIVVIYDGIRPIGSVVVAANGTWSFTPTADLKGGAHSFAAIAHDTAGNFGASSAVVSVTVAVTVIPTPAAPTLTNDSGLPIVAGSTTNDAHPHINGTGTAGDIIKVLDNGVVIGSTTIKSDGTWTFTPSPNLANGAHDIAVIETNPAGTASSAASSPTHITIDTSVPATPAAPTLTDDSGLPIVAGGTTNDSHPHINGGGATPGDTIQVLDNGVVIGSTTVKPDGTWSFTPSPDLTPGAHDITVIDTNAAGTPSLPSNPTHITIDTSTPATPATPVLTDDSGLLIPAGSTTNDNHPHISGTGTAGDIIKVYDSAILIGSVKIGSDGKWTFTPTTDLSNAAHAINVTETNPAGTASGHSGSVIFTVDSTLPNAPVITAMNDYRMDNGAFIAAVPLGGTVTSANVAFGGTATANGVVYVYDGATLITSVKADASGAWFYASKTYTNGLHDISATQKSPAGVETAHSNHWTFTVNPVIPATPTAPVITNDAGTVIPAGGTTNDTHPHIAGTGTAGDVITVYDNGTVIGSTTVAGNGTWSFTPATDLPSGATAITVVETNSSGNASASSPPANLVIDTSTPAKPPVPVLTDDSGAVIPSGSYTGDGHPHISGTGTAGDIITVYDGANVMGSVKIDSTGHWTFMPSSDVSIGTHSISVTDTNAAGTTSPHSDAASFFFTQVPLETVTISGLYDDTSGSLVLVSPGGSTQDTTPILKGTVDHALLSGESLVVYRDGTAVGTATMNGTSWSFNDSGVAAGSHTYTARVERAEGVGDLSAGYSFTEGKAVDTYTVTGPAYLEMTCITGVYTSSCASAFNVYLFATGLVNNTTGAQVSVADVAFEIYNSAGQRVTSSTGWVYNTSPKTFDITYTFAWVYRPTDGGAPIFLDVRPASYYSNLTWSYGKTWAPGFDYSGDTSQIALVPSAYKSTLLSATHHTADAETVVAATHDAVDAQTVAAATADTTETTPHHTVVGEHDAFKGTTGHDIVDLNADPTSYFKETTAHVEGSTVHAIDPTTGTATAVNTLHLTGDHQVLDLTSLTGQTAAAKISGIEVIDLGGQHNTLKLSLVDVLNLGEADLFMKDGKQQMMVNGKEGDEVDLSNSHIAGLAEGEWQAHGTAEVGGVTYNVYEHSSANTELLVEHAVRIEMH